MGRKAQATILPPATQAAKNSISPKRPFASAIFSVAVFGDVVGTVVAGYDLPLPNNIPFINFMFVYNIELIYNIMPVLNYMAMLNNFLGPGASKLSPVKPFWLAALVLWFSTSVTCTIMHMVLLLVLWYLLYIIHVKSNLLQLGHSCYRHKYMGNPVPGSKAHYPILSHMKYLLEYPNGIFCVLTKFPVYS